MRALQAENSLDHWLEGWTLSRCPFTSAVFVIAIEALRASVRGNPRRHGGRVCLGLVGNDDAFPLRDLLGVQHLCRTYRFGGDLPSRFTASFLGRMLVEKCAADRYRHLVAGRGLDALVPDEAVGKAPHRRCWRISSGVFANCGAKQGRSSGGGALLQFADDALGDIAHGVDRTDHLLLADNDIVEQTFKLRRHAPGPCSPATSP